MDNIENKLKNLTFIVMLGFIILGALIIGLYFKDNSISSTNTVAKETQTDTEEEYDVSKMNEVSVDEALALFKDKDFHVLYIGREDCSVCRMIVPVLNEAQEELDFEINYYDLNKASNFKEELKELASKFTVKATANNVEDTIGNLFIENGYTPTVVVIKNGKVVDGFIGYRTIETIEELFKEYID